MLLSSLFTLAASLMAHGRAVGRMMAEQLAPSQLSTHLDGDVTKGDAQLSLGGSGQAVNCTAGGAARDMMLTGC